ncbi:UNVERIFIED_CONTAM: hypothetical protein RMT77_005045 [Armadillidium vulgare]
MIKIVLLTIFLVGTLGAPYRTRPLGKRHHLGIVGGQDAAPGEFPYQLSFQELTILDNYFHFCGASIYNEFTAICAGHCVYGEEYDDPQDLFVVAGEYDLSVESGDEQRLRVSQIALHEEYDGANYYNDISLLRVNTSFTFNDLVGPVTLPAQGQQTTGNCTVTGWGDLEEGGTSPSILQKVVVPVVSDVDCDNDYILTTFTESWLCAGQAGKDSCQGDSGGPLWCGDYQGGIVSWGNGCARARFPGVYTEVAYFVDWILAHAW